MKIFKKKIRAERVSRLLELPFGQNSEGKMGNENSTLPNQSTSANKSPISLDVSFRWKEITPTGNVPKGREGHCAITYKDEIYIFGGGWSFEGSPVQSNELYRFSPSTTNFKKPTSILL